MKIVMVADKATGLATYRGDCPDDDLVTEWIMDRLANEINSTDFIWARFSRTRTTSIVELMSAFEKYADSKGVKIRWMSHEEYLRFYRGFMENPDNIHKCHKCPENYGYDGELPCGQQNCWVSIHCAFGGVDE